VLFLVDRLELEDQAYKAFVTYLKNDCISVIYKRHRDGGYSGLGNEEYFVRFPTLRVGSGFAGFRFAPFPPLCGANATRPFNP
jgi:hypothetical protein